MDDEYEAIVIGGGIVGLWSAYCSCQKGFKTLLLEQFPLPHTRGSSHGQTRIIRYLNGSGCLSKLMPESFRMWRALHKKYSTRKLIKDCGSLLIFDKEDQLKSYKAAADELEVPYDLISGAQANERFPGLNISDNLQCLFDPQAALLLADKCISVLIEEIKNANGTILDNTRVDNIIPVNKEKVIVHSHEKQFTCKSLIITCGPWSQQVMEKCGIYLPLKSVRISVHYFEEVGGENLYDLQNNFPSIVDFSGEIKTFSTPVHEYPGLTKLCYFGGVECNPDARDKASALIEEYRKLRLHKLHMEKLKFYPKLHTEPGLNETCMYTNSPDMKMVIDHHPEFPNIAFGAGFSGSGFKTAPAVGKTLVAMVTGQNIPEYMKSTSMDRFKNNDSANIL